MWEEKITCTTDFVLIICIRHPRPTPISMSGRNKVKVFFSADKLSFHADVKIRILKMIPPKQADIAIRG